MLARTSRAADPAGPDLVETEDRFIVRREDGHALVFDVKGESIGITLYNEANHPVTDTNFVGADEVGDVVDKLHAAKVRIMSRAYRLDGKLSTATGPALDAIAADLAPELGGDR